MESITTYKGMDENMRCRGFQYEVGKEYEADGKIRECENGFHGCERPLDVLSYYSPNKSLYFVAEQSGELSRDGKDSKWRPERLRSARKSAFPAL